MRCSPSLRPTETDAKTLKRNGFEGAPLQTIEATASTATPNGHESYERGTALKNVGLFRQAAEYFEIAAQDPAYALKGFAQMGLSLKRSGKQEGAVAAFQGLL